MQCRYMYESLEFNWNEMKWISSLFSLSVCPVFLLFVAIDIVPIIACKTRDARQRCRSAASAHENHEWNFFNDWWMIITVRTLIERDRRTDTHAHKTHTRCWFMLELYFTSSAKIGIYFAKQIYKSWVRRDTLRASKFSQFLYLIFAHLVISETKLMNISWLSFSNGFVRRRQAMGKKLQST